MCEEQGKEGRNELWVNGNAMDVDVAWAEHQRTFFCDAVAHTHIYDATRLLPSIHTVCVGIAILPSFLYPFLPPPPCHYKSPSFIPVLIP